MPSKLVATQAALDRAAIDQLRIIGGSQTRDDDIIYEGTQWKVPAKYVGNPTAAAKEFIRFVELQEEEVVVDKTFMYLPFDGAHATYHCLKQFFGYAQSKARMGPFGKEPPQEITIDIGYDGGVMQHVTVPWGDLVLPGLRGATLTTTQAKSPETGGQVFRLYAKCRRADKPAIDGFYKMVEQYLEEHSIYRGKAMTGDMSFIDTEAIDPSKFVYTEQAWADIEVAILSPLRDNDIIKRAGLATKRASLLEGPYGTGKSGFGSTATKVAVANGVTAFNCRPGQDDPFLVMKVAAMYAGTKYRAFVFIEDVDTFASQTDPQYITRLLDTFDSARTKGIDLTLVMTTNHKDEIHKGMLRPGRLDAIIEIGAMDRPGVEKLARLVIGDNLEPDVDFDRVFASTEGYMPAFVREGLERAIRYTIARTRTIGQINTDDLVRAMGSLRPQHDLHEGASDRREKLPPLDQMFRRMFNEEIVPPMDDIVDATAQSITRKMHGAVLTNPETGKRGWIINTNE